MILYLDPSALVKRYIREANTDEVIAACEAAQTLAVSRLAWVEAHTAFARRERECPQDAPLLSQAKAQLKADWAHLLLIEPIQSVLDLAADYADTFALRAYDSVQLASAATLQTAHGQPIQFACFDARLSKAARVLHMKVISHY